MKIKQLVQIFGDKIIPEQSDKIDLNQISRRSGFSNWWCTNTWSRSSKINNQRYA